MACVTFITHPDVQIDASVALTEWPLSLRGRDRMRALLAKPWVQDLDSVWSSTERKAVDGAEILAGGIAATPRQLATLGENDRSATGYLPKAAFEATADAFFANPHHNIRGWERAIDAQTRIVTAIRSVIAQAPPYGDVAIVSHGAVGALLLCHLKRCRISRTEDQPPTNGRNFFRFDIATEALKHGWQPIDT